PLTRAALANAAGGAQQQISELGVAALHEAEKYIGIKEDPPHSNQTQFGAWFGANGVAWCNIFVSYCFVKGANYVIASDFKGGRGAGIYAGKGCAYVPTTEAWLRATGMWLGRVPPLPGDIVIYNWDGGEADHIGIVSKHLGNGEFEAIEGNTSFGNDSNGGEVMRRVRNLLQVNGFGRVLV
ncbi:MAG TPA: CHAP domain-containing protein, partial [Kofleriaceae bacterium]